MVWSPVTTVPPRISNDMALLLPVMNLIDWSNSIAGGAGAPSVQSREPGPPMPQPRLDGAPATGGGSAKNIRRKDQPVTADETRAFALRLMTEVWEHFTSDA